MFKKAIRDKLPRGSRYQVKPYRDGVHAYVDIIGPSEVVCLRIEVPTIGYLKSVYVFFCWNGYDFVQVREAMDNGSIPDALADVPTP